MRVHEVYLSNFRCFRDPTTVPFRQITLLVGENSSGKTALLAALAGLFPSKSATPLFPDFNAPPFQLGRFEDIVTRRTSMPRQSRTFTIGATVAGSPSVPDEKREVPHVSVLGEYRNLDGKPVAKALRVHVPGLLMSLHRRQREEGSPYEYAFCSLPEEPGSTALTLQQMAEQGICESHGVSYSPLLLPDEMLRSVNPFSLLSFFALTDSNAESREQRLESLSSFLVSLSGHAIHHLAPIRAVPQRTYESFTERVTPEGTHVPFVLERETRAAVSGVAEGLRQFGLESGLFSDIQVRRFGEPKGSRFAVLVKIGDSWRNFTDVGYGVPQVLPPVLDSLRLPKGTVVTMQEPEVHLHPRAQAALGSLLVRTSVEHDKSFIVETHSDYIVDRVRQEVARGTIDCSEVVILFFSQTTRGSRVVPIRVDQYGKPEKPPKGYRSFFLKEALALLGAE